MIHKPSIATLWSLLVAVFLALSGSLFSLAHPISAQSTNQQQTAGLQMQAQAAYDGYFKYGEWLPVWVDLENQGSDIEGEIRVQVSNSQGTMVFTAPVSLPSGSRKRMPVYVLPNNFSRELDVRLVSGDEALFTKKVTVRPQPNISYFVGLLAPERGALSLLNGVKFSGQERPKILVDLALDELPERAEGLRAFDLLVLNDTDTSKLSPEQSQALAGWVQQGGRLVIGGGSGAQKTVAGLPQTLLPFSVESSTEVGPLVLDPLVPFGGNNAILVQGPFIMAHGAINNGQVVVGNKENPLVIEQAVGAGAVDFIALDVAGVPFNGWAGTQSFWEELIGPSGSFLENMPFDVSPRQWRANTLSYALSNIPSLDLPSVQNVSILLGIYILIVGPINYLVLRRLRRLHFAWMTIPAITVLFTAAAFGIGYGMRGNDLILNRIALVETKSDGNAAVTSYMGLFSPRMQSYEVNVHGESLVSPMTGYDAGPWNSSVPVAGNQMELVQGEPSKVKGLTVNQWAMQSFMAEGTWQDFGNFSANLRLENENLVGTVRNDTRYTITDVVVAIQSRFARLGDLAPGEEKKVDLGLANMQSDRMGPPLSYRLYQEGFTNGPMPRALEQKSNILNSVFENGPWAKVSSREFSSGNSGSNQAGEIIVFGWLDDAPPKVEVPNNRLTQKTTALVYTYMDYGLPEDGYLTIPPGLIPGSMTKIPSEGGSCGISTSVHMSRGDAQFEFKVPGELPTARVDTLKLSLWRDSGNAGSMPAVSLYQWSDNSWINIQDPIQGTNVIENAASYVNENGIVRIQLSSESDTFGCIYLDLGLEATLQPRQGG